MMKEPDIAIKVLSELMEECGTHADWLDSTPLQIENCFNMIHNLVRQSHDLLWYYWKVWYPNELELRSRQNPTEDDAIHFAKQTGERLMLVLRSAFIFSLSIVEYAMKLVIKQAKRGPLLDWYDKKKKKNLRVYLKGIMEESKRKKMLSLTEYNSWGGMIELRNVIMHNNAIVDENTSLAIGTITLDAKTGEMVSYPISKRPRIIKVLVELTRSWLEKFLEMHPNTS